MKVLPDCIARLFGCPVNSPAELPPTVLNAHTEERLRTLNQARRTLIKMGLKTVHEKAHSPASLRDDRPLIVIQRPNAPLLDCCTAAGQKLHWHHIDGQRHLVADLFGVRVAWVQ